MDSRLEALIMPKKTAKKNNTCKRRLQRNTQDNLAHCITSQRQNSNTPLNSSFKIIVNFHYTSQRVN